MTAPVVPRDADEARRALFAVVLCRQETVAA
jgi:hypothetical protein